jgi:hypothetical protein
MKGDYFEFSKSQVCAWRNGLPHVRTYKGTDVPTVGVLWEIKAILVKILPPRVVVCVMSLQSKFDSSTITSSSTFRPASTTLSFSFFSLSYSHSFPLSLASFSHTHTISLTHTLSTCECNAMILNTLQQKRRNF